MSHIIVSIFFGCFSLSAGVLPERVESDFLNLVIFIPALVIRPLCTLRIRRVLEGDYVTNLMLFR